jgi:hypothetical protein
MEQNVQSAIFEIKERLIRMETKLDNFDKYKEKTDEALNVAKICNTRIKEIEDNNRWLWRTTLGACLCLGIEIVFNLMK